MPDRRTDQIAREAARLLATGRADDMTDAIRSAADALGFRDVPLPSAGRVRKHAQAMSMQSVGEAEYLSTRAKVWQVAEQIMTVFEHAMPDVESMLVGRAAQGHIDGGVTIHIRLYTRSSISDIAAALVHFGYEEPAFATAQTRHGRFSQVRLVDERIDIVLTRCPPEMASQSELDLFSGKQIETMTLAALRRRLDEARA